jgi:O-antigen/teichoic acid export membrane protein
MIFPIFAVFMYYARPFVETLFTAQYVAAVPLFRIYLFMMLLQCFEMGTPLRTANQNRAFIFGSMLSLAVDIGFILAFFRILGFVAPALAVVLGELAIMFYLGWRVMRIYSVGIGGLLMWNKILLVVVACLAATPVLFAGELLPLNEVLRAVIFSCFYFAAYLVVVGRFHVEEIELIFAKVVKALRRMMLRGTRS